MSTLATRIGPADHGRAMTLEQAVAYALGGNMAEPPAQPEAKPGDLTPREREVAALVAHGLTNRQIGQALVLSEQTAATHVRNILGKLNLRSRSQLATWITQHQASEPRAD